MLIATTNGRRGAGVWESERSTTTETHKSINLERVLSAMNCLLCGSAPISQKPFWPLQKQRLAFINVDLSVYFRVITTGSLSNFDFQFLLPVVYPYCIARLRLRHLILRALEQITALKGFPTICLGKMTELVAPDPVPSPSAEKAATAQSTNLPATTAGEEPKNNGRFSDDLYHSNTFGRVFSIVFGPHMSTFLTISLLSVGLRYLLTFVSDVVNGPQMGADYNMDDVPDTTFDSVATTVMQVVENIIFYVTMCLNDGAIIQSVAEVYLGERPTAVNSIGTVAFKLVQLVGSCLLAFVIFFVPFFFVMIISGVLAMNGFDTFLFLYLGTLAIWIYVFLITYNMYPSIVVENSNVWESLHRSYALAQGYMCEIFTLTFLLAICKTVCSTFTVYLALFVDSPIAHVAGLILAFALSVFFAALSSM